MAQNPPPLNVVIQASDQTRAAFESAKAGLEGVRTSAAGLQGVITGAVAGLAALGAVVEFRKFVDGAAAMDDMAERTGATVEKLSALAGVARVSGISLDIVENALIRLAKGLAGADEESKGAGNALAALGLKAEELKKLDTADALKRVADKLAEYKDGAGKTALAIDLLGKSGAQALPYLKDLAETQELQAKLTAEQAAQAENLGKNLNRLTASMGGAWKEFSAAVLPTVDEFVKGLLGVVQGTGGVREEIKRLSADGTIREWAENAAVGVAVVVDAFRNLVNLIPVVGQVGKIMASDFEQIWAKFRYQNMSGPARDILVGRIRREREDAERALGEATAKFLDAPQFSSQIRARFEALRQTVQAAPDAKKTLDYSSRVDKAGGEAKDELKAIETYVQSIREQVVGATDGEFEKMRQKAIDVFGAIDLSKLGGADRERFAAFFAQVTEDIDTLEEKAVNAKWAQALAESFKQVADAGERADQALAQFNEAMSQQGQDLEFEVAMVGKLAAERQKLTAIRRIDLDQRRAEAAVPANADNRDERLADIAKTADNARERIAALYDDLRGKSRDLQVGLASSVSEYLDKIGNDAENVRNAFTNAFRGMEDALTSFVVKGKLDFKGLVDSILADIVRIQIRNNITGPLAAALNGAGGGWLSSLFGGRANPNAGIASGLDLLDLPSFAVGTDYVPYDMVARIHKGERIVPAAENAVAAAPVVNIINNGGAQVQAAAPRFDAGRWVQDVMINALRTDGGVRAAFAGALRAPAA